MVDAGFYGLSLWGENGQSLLEVCHAARLRNLRVRVSSVGRLRAVGLEPIRLGRAPHLSISFSTIPSDTELSGLARAFDPPIPNPYLAD